MCNLNNIITVLIAFKPLMRKGVKSIRDMLACLLKLSLKLWNIVYAGDIILPAISIHKADPLDYDDSILRAVFAAPVTSSRVCEEKCTCRACQVSELLFLFCFFFLLVSFFCSSKWVSSASPSSRFSNTCNDISLSKN